MDQGFDTGQLGKLLMVAGAVLFGFGLMVVLLGKTGLFRLPGDINIGGENWKVFFPITTCILISVVLTAILWIVRWFMRK